MTIIDVHTHIFPDDIAKKALWSISKEGKFTYYGDGTINSLFDHMREDEVIFSFNLPVATSPAQVRGINERVVEWNKSYRNFLSFGALHPRLSLSELKDEVEFLALNGVKGVKLHPEYQDFYPDAPEMTTLYEECVRHGIFVFFHSGRDLAFSNVHGTPRRFAQVASIKGIRIILAHLGGYQMWDEVENYIMGIKNIYLDTSYTLELENWQMKEIIFGHGPYHILFGSDFPWVKAREIVKKIKSLDLGFSVEEMIFYKNAKWLFDI